MPPLSPLEHVWTATEWGGLITLVFSGLTGLLVAYGAFVLARMKAAGEAAAASAAAAVKKIDEQHETIKHTDAKLAEVAEATDGNLTTLKEQNAELLRRLDVKQAEQLATMTRALAEALAKVAAQQADIVIRADAKIPPVAPRPAESQSRASDVGLGVSAQQARQVMGQIDRIEDATVEKP